MAVGVTEQVAAVVPAQLPPVQTYELAAGLQLVVRVALPPTTIDAGLALTLHSGALLAARESKDGPARTNRAAK